MATLTITINRVAHTVEADPAMPLLWVLRDLLNLITPIADVTDQMITTIEGLAPDGITGDIHPVQQAWLTEAVAQCGYCQAGQIMTAVALLNTTPKPTSDEIDSAFAHTLCRCGTYLRIRRVIQRMVEKG